jgi:hypothetical protein
MRAWDVRVVLLFGCFAVHQAAFGLKQGSVIKLTASNLDCDASTSPSTSIYNLVAGVVDVLKKNGIDSLLHAGSVLGVRRHFGNIPGGGDKDVDMQVLSTDLALIECILDGLGHRWHATEVRDSSP